VQPVIMGKINSDYYGEYSAAFPMVLYDIQDLFLFKQYRGRKLCAPFVEAIRDHAPVAGNAAFMLSVNPENVPAVKCYKRAEFTVIAPEDELAGEMDRYWQSRQGAGKHIKFTHMIVNRLRRIKEEIKFDAAAKKIMKKNFKLEYKMSYLYTYNAAGIVDIGKDSITLNYFRELAISGIPSVKQMIADNPTITQAIEQITQGVKKYAEYYFVTRYIIESATSTTGGPIADFLKGRNIYDLALLEPSKVRRILWELHGLADDLLKTAQ